MTGAKSLSGMPKNGLSTEEPGAYYYYYVFIRSNEEQQPMGCVLCRWGAGLSGAGLAQQALQRARRHGLAEQVALEGGAARLE